MQKIEETLSMPKLSYSLASATKIADVGLTKLYEEINAGRLKAKKFGKRTLVTAVALEEWINNLPDYGTETQQ